MALTLQLSLDDARCLYDHLTRHILEVDHELVHTERHRLRRELAADSARLRQIKTKLEQLLEAGG
jgi:hypothetical protein